MRCAVDATHEACGLLWHFPFPFPMFRTAPFGTSADVVVEFGGPFDAVQAHSMVSVEASFNVPGVANFQISDGNRIRVDRLPNCADEDLLLALMGTATAFVLHQRGFVPLHGSGISTPHGAVLIVGHSGAGKSTTLGALLQRGYPMICDDLAAVRIADDGVARVYPGAPLYKLWGDSASALGVETAGFPRVRASMDKFLVPVAEQQVLSPVHLHAIYQLSIHDGLETVIEPHSGAAKFNALLDHTWQKLSVKSMGLHAVHFRSISAIANQVRLVSVARPKNPVGNIATMVSRIEADFLTDR